MSAEKLGTQIRKEQIAQAALSLVSKHGLKKLSIASVARQVGIVPSAIYRHYKNKEGILDAILNYIQALLLYNIIAVCQETSEPLERLRRLLFRHIRMIQENLGIPRIVFSEDLYHGRVDRKARMYATIKTYLDQVSEMILQGKKDGQIRPEVNSGTAAIMFLGLIQPAAILWHMSDGEFDVTNHAEKVWKIFCEAIRRRQPESSGTDH